MDPPAKVLRLSQFILPASWAPLRAAEGVEASAIATRRRVQGRLAAPATL